MNTILNAVTEYLNSSGVRLHEAAGAPVLETIITLENAHYICRAIALEEDRRLIFQTLCPIKVRGNVTPLVAEFITRANAGLAIGNFEFDFEAGEILYKTSIDVTGGELTAGLIDRLLKVSIATMDGFMPKLMSVAYGGVSPIRAMADEGGLFGATSNSDGERSKWN